MSSRLRIEREVARGFSILECDTGELALEDLMIVQDTREVRPLDFSALPVHVPVIKHKLETGDYSVVGCEHLVALERKSPDDLVACLCYDLERFENQLTRLSLLWRSAVVVECTMDEMASEQYRSAANGHSMLNFSISMEMKHGVPFVWTGSRFGSAWYVANSLAQAHKLCIRKGWKRELPAQVRKGLR